MPTPYSAKNAKVRFGAGPSTLHAKAWEITPKADLVDTTNFESGGYKESIFGIHEASITITFDDDGANNVRDLGLTEGASVSLKLYLNGVGGPHWNGTINIATQPMRADVRQAVGCTLTGEFTGTFSGPTGNAA
jgi:hypothetical protein